MDFIARPMPLPLPPNVPQDAAVKRIHNAHMRCVDECSEIKAAIAYGSKDNMGFLRDCQERGRPLEFFGRYDGSCPVDPEILRWFLDAKSPNLIYRAVAKYLHAKVIWWVGAGVYIGSANLTDRAWNKNFEAGVFMSDDELEHFGLLPELEAFFDGLRATSRELSDEIYKEQLKLFTQRRELMRKLRDIEDRFNDTDPFVAASQNPIAAVPEKSASTRFKLFSDEWNKTLNLMRTIAHHVSKPENTPNWMPTGIPSGAQADQFLHAYYFRRVRPGSVKDAHEFMFEQHKANRDLALQDALRWWKQGDYEYEQELRMLSVNAPLLRSLFAKDKLLNISETEWIEALPFVHAASDHAAKMEGTLIGLPPGQSTDWRGRARAFAKWLWTQRTATGRTPQESLHHVIWGPGNIEKRIFDGCHDPQWKLPHVKTSSLGEIVGWARPDEFPPRNMRTSKALRALGNPVRVNI